MTAHRFIRVVDALAELQVDDAFLQLLEEEGLVHVKCTSEGERVLSVDDIERLRVARLLTSELEVNLAGLEVVMHMREEMIAMRRQFSDILETMIAELRRQMGR